MVAYVFPGQGSQTKGMGGALFSAFPEITQKANDILGYYIENLCLNDPENKLNQTNYTQPALYVVNALMYMKKMQEGGAKPDFLAGHSLGEYNALLAAGVFDFAEGLQLVKKRGELMSQVSGGGMAAVVGLPADQVQALLDQHQLHDISIANYNTYTQVILTGPKERILSCEAIFLNAGAMIFMPLKVSGAFHSPYMKEAQQVFAESIKQVHFNPPQIPVIANVTGTPYSANNIATLLAEQISHPVLWTKSIEYIKEQGETTFEEIGPGKVLTNIISRIQAGK